MCFFHIALWSAAPVGPAPSAEGRGARAVLSILPIVRMDTHEYDYMYLHGYTLGSEWVYRNPYLPEVKEGANTTFYGRVWDFESTTYRLTDDEITVADIMRGMSKYVDTASMSTASRKTRRTSTCCS